jgi:bla regulator protein blaR1
VLRTVWVAGFAAMLLLFGRKWTRMYRIVRAAKPMQLDFPIPVRESATLYEPGVFGIFRPTLLLPGGIAAKLAPAQFQAILAHEFCHVRRRDNLTAAVHMLIQSAFWFHPLLWWIGSRLIDERERACDEEVLRLGSTPVDYAEGILNVCKLYTEAPAACISGVTGSDLKKRIEAIMKQRMIQKLTAARKILLAGAGVIAAGVPVMIGLMHAPAAKAQASTAQAPKWEAVAIRRCDAPPPNRGGRRGIDSSSQGRYWLECGNVENLIRGAYILFADGQKINPHQFYESLSGGPGWIRSDLYDIEAKPEGAPALEMMRGPMMRALLEDRFKLKIHREVKEVPVYNLVIAKGGPKMPKVDDASCPPRPTQEERLRQLQTGRFGPRLCGLVTWGKKPPGPSLMVENDHGVTLESFATGLTRVMDRPVIDRTGLSGLYDFHVEFSPDESMPAFMPAGVMKGYEGPPRLTDIPTDPSGPSYFTAIQEQLGLKLEPARGPGDFFVIDSIDRPSEN